MSPDPQGINAGPVDCGDCLAIFARVTRDRGRLAETGTVVMGTGCRTCLARRA